MELFFNVKHATINAAKVRELYTDAERDDAVNITFDDGYTELYSTDGDGYKVIEKLERSIIQIIPCTAPIYNIYENEDGSHWHERVHYIVLCLDGEIRSLYHGDGDFEFAEDLMNFVGCFDEDSLIEYPTDKDNETV
jgi:hypothetical protein